MRNPMTEPAATDPAKAKGIIIGVAAAMIALSGALFLLAGTGRSPVPET